MDGFSSSGTALLPDPQSRLHASHPGRIPQDDGFIDFYGYHTGSDHFIFCGWVRTPWPAHVTPSLVADFQDGQLSGPCESAFHIRTDLNQHGVGVILMVRGTNREAGHLQLLSLRFGQTTLSLLPAQDLPSRPEPLLHMHTLSLTKQAAPSAGRATLLRNLARRSYTGANTLESLSRFIRIGLDDYFALPPAGFILTGWLVHAPNAITSIAIRSGSLITILDLETSIRFHRPDITQAIPDYPTWCRQSGFVIRATGALQEGQPSYLEIETQDGETGHVPIPTQTLHGLDAAKRFLSLPPFETIPDLQTIETIIAPAMESFTIQHLQKPPSVTCRQFSTPHEKPVASIIIPLYGRIDFLEYQLALLSEQDSAIADIIYVLDDPDHTIALQQLAQSAYARFSIPFRILFLDSNRGYGPANNIALGYTNAPYVCFLNSDVSFGPTPWIARLAGHLQSDPSIGAVGPLLLFEDHSIQHEGISFHRVQQFNQLPFAQHTNKGLKPNKRGQHDVVAITGACLMMRTQQAKNLEGFDENFLIGDFEDTDLCLRLGQQGLRCVVDHDISLFHLERQSQTSGQETWRRNLTLYNSWLHEKGWPQPPGCSPCAS